jgi:hypothetical protein
MLASVTILSTYYIKYGALHHMKIKPYAFAALAFLFQQSLATSAEASCFILRHASPGLTGTPPACPSSASPTTIPAHIYATWNPTDIYAGLSLSQDLLTITNPRFDGAYMGRATQGKSSGKWYWEVTVDTSMSLYGADTQIGIANATTTLDQASPDDSWYYSTQLQATWGAWPNTFAAGIPGWVITAGFPDMAWAKTPVSGLPAGTTYMVALDMDNHAVYLGVDGFWNGVDPTSGAAATGAAISGPGMVEVVYPAIAVDYTSSTANFGATPFRYPVPAGYHAGVYN